MCPGFLFQHQLEGPINGQLRCKADNIEIKSFNIPEHISCADFLDTGRTLL